MASAQYTSMLQCPTFAVASDIRPWGGISPIFPIDGAVQSVGKTPGASFDTAELILYNANFGDETTPYLPVSISEGANTFFRGFVTTNIGEITPTGEVQKVTLLCYKWLMSKRTILRGKWYMTKGNVNSGPLGGMGSGISSGSQKFDYEKFRSDFQEEDGYLQNETLVFNQGGTPDCFENNATSGQKCVFYLDKINYDGTNGIPGSYFEAQDYDGFYWTWATIVRHIYEYWIDPYNVVLAAVNLESNDIDDLAAIDPDLLTPMNFSVEGYNPLTALDFVVSSIPGKWYWYLEYSALDVNIRIRELEEIVGVGDITLNTCDRGDKLVNSNANYSKATVKRDSSKAVENVVGLGGKLKLVTTVKLLPLWRKYDQGGDVFTDFANAADLTAYKTWLKFTYQNDKFKQDSDVLKITAEQRSRFPRIYRYYGISEEGGLLGEQIVSEDLSVIQDVIDLTGDVGNEYTDFTDPVGAVTATLRDYFFLNARIEREMSPPEFKRFSDKILVFMFDPLFKRVPKDAAAADIQKAPKGQSAVVPNAAQLTAEENREAWVLPDRDNINYDLDEKNLTIMFDTPQMQMENSFRPTESDKFVESVSKFAFGSLNSRDVYVTATFSTDVASVLSSEISGGFVETNSGAPFSAYVQARNQEIIYHKNAWYPLSLWNKDIEDPADSSALCDGHKVGDVIRRCDDFDDYREYIGEGHYELARALINWKEGYLDYEESVNVEMPYFTLAHTLGMTLTEIGNTSYTDLASYLLGISWSRVGDSDCYTTNLILKNTYNTDRKNIDFGPQKHDENKNKFNLKVKFNFFNERTDGSLPSL